MNGDGSSGSAGVDGQDIAPSSVTSSIGRFNSLRFIQASQGDSLNSAENYILPIVPAPFSATSRYTFATPVYADGGYIDTDAGPNNVWQAQLIISPFLAFFNIPFADNTRYTNQQVFSTINAAIAAQIAAWGLTTVITLTLNTALAPSYRTNVTVTGAGAISFSLGNYIPASFSEKYLGIPVTFPSVNANQTVISGTNAFTSIVGSKQLRWVVLP